MSSPPRAGCLFFDACQTVSYDISSTCPSATNSFARGWRVHWHRPDGGSLQASSTGLSSPKPLTITLSGRLGWGRGSRT